MINIKSNLFDQFYSPFFLILIYSLLGFPLIAQWKNDWPKDYGEIGGLRQFNKGSLILWSHEGLYYSRDKGDTWIKPKGLDSILPYRVEEASDGLYLTCYDITSDLYQLKRNPLKDGILWEIILEGDNGSDLKRLIGQGPILQLSGKLIAFEDYGFNGSSAPVPKNIYIFDTIQQKFIVSSNLTNLARVTWKNDTLYYNSYSDYILCRTSDLGNSIDTLTKEKVRRFHIFNDYIVGQQIDPSLFKGDTLMISLDRGSTWSKLHGNGRFPDFSRIMKFSEDLYFTNSTNTALYHFDPIKDIILDSFINIKLVPFSLISDKGLVMGAVMDEEFISFEDYISRYDRNGKEKILSSFYGIGNVISGLYSFEDTLYLASRTSNLLFYKKMPNDQNNLRYLGAAEKPLSGNLSIFASNFCVFNHKLYYPYQGYKVIKGIDIPTGVTSEEYTHIEEIREIKRTKDFLIVSNGATHLEYKLIDDKNWKELINVVFDNNHDYIFYISKLDSGLYRINKTSDELIYKPKFVGSEFITLTGHDSCIFMIEFNSNMYKKISFSNDNGLHFQEISYSGLPVNLYSKPMLRFFKNHIYANIFPSGCHVYDFSKKLWTQYNANAPKDLESIALFENQLYGSFYPSLYKRTLDSTFVVKGFVYYDENNNYVRDTSERGLKDIKFRFSQNRSTYFSGENGNILTGTDLPQDELKIVENDYNNYSPNRVEIQAKDISQQFAYAPAKDLYDLDLRIFSKDVFRPGFNTDIYINIKSIYHDLHEIETQLEYDDSKLDFVSISTPSFENNNGVLKFKIADILLKSDTLIHITFRTKNSVALNDTIILKSSAITNRMENNVENNKAEIQALVQSSYDPNDKLTLKKEIKLNEIINGIEELVYTIRCQNDGTNPTTYVIIHDTLDNRFLDISTFNIVNASHPYHILLDDNIMILSFSPLELEPSSTNYPKSQAYISYRIKTKQLSNLNEFSISNKASIYFDYNPPIETEDCKIIFRDVVNTKEQKQDQKQFWTHNDYKITLDPLYDLIGWDLNIYSLEGKKLYSQNSIFSNYLEISIRDWPPGMYFSIFCKGDKKIFGKIPIIK